MDYNECKKELDATRREHSRLQNELRSVTAELEMITSESAKEEARYKIQLKEAKDIELQRHVEHCCKVYRDAVASVDRKIDSLGKQHEENLSKITAESIISTESSGREYYQEIKGTLEELAENLLKTLGLRFKDELMSQLGTQKITLKPEDLPSFIAYFTSLNAELFKNADKNDHSISDLLKQTTNGITLERLKENPINLILAFLLLAIGSVVFAEIVLPFYVIALMVSLIFNLRKHYKLYKAILVMKAVQDNIAAIEDMLLKQAEKKAKARREREDRLYNKCLREYLDEKDSATARMHSAEEKAKESFVFHGGNLATARKADLASLQNKLYRLKQQKERLEFDIQRMLKRSIEQEKTLARIAGDIPKEYLNPEKVGSDFIFNPKFIFDVEHNNPEFFMHPEASCLFIYKDFDDVVSFVKLINLQLRVRFSPSAFTSDVYDRKYGGIAFQPFIADSYKHLFQIHVNSEEFTQAFKDVDELITKRTRLILSSSDDIKSYNSLMLSSESVPESYMFSFLLDPEQSDVQNESFLRAYRVGGKLGVFFHVFVQKDVFFEFGDSARTLANEAGKCFILQNGKYNQRAKNYVMETMIKDNNRTSLPTL